MTVFHQGHALIIGVGSYAYDPVHSVPITAADAQAVASVVQDPQFCGYPASQVDLLSEGDATRDRISAALDRLAQTNKEDTVLLFYSGHGNYDTSGNYTLTTHDTQWRGEQVVPGTAIGHAELLEKLRAIPAERVLLLFNACHAGALSPTLGDDAPPTGQALPQQTANALLATGSGRIVITACREHQYSFIGSGEYTLFAQALVEGMRGGGDVYNRGGYISSFDLYTHLYCALKEAVPRKVPRHVRSRFGSTQEPELTVIKGVGPFAVALYRGASTLGAFPSDHRPADETAVREVEPARSLRALHSIMGTATVQGDNSGQNVGVNYGTMTHTSQDFQNTASNQGAQGTFQQPVTFNQPHSTFNQQGQTVHSNQYNAHSIQTSGDVTQVRGDYISGDKISGDIHVSGVSGSGIVIGHKGQVQLQPGDDAAAFDRAFAQIYVAINSRRDDPNVDKDEITATVKSIQQEAQKGVQANEHKLTRWLRHLADMAADIFAMTVATLTSPQAAFATVAQRAAAQVKQERGQG